MIMRAADDNLRCADFIACAASRADVLAVNALRMHAHYVEEIDSRIGEVAKSAHERLIALAEEIAQEFDLLAMEYRKHSSGG